MIALKRILLPTDFSDYSAHATKYACAFAEQFDAELHLLYVIQDPWIPMAPLEKELPTDEEMTDLQARVEQALSEVLDPAWAEGKRIVHAIRQGSPFVEIVRYAQEQEIDMIVITTHGRTGLAHVLLGSIAENVVRKAPCPVLTVRPTEHQFVMP